MDATVFPQWIKCAKEVLDAEKTAIGNRKADIELTQ